jgi:hypothetical protein
LTWCLKDVLLDVKLNNNLDFAFIGVPLVGPVHVQLGQPMLVATITCVFAAVKAAIIVIINHT